MTPRLYMVELAVADVRAAVAWYAAVLQRQPAFIDEVGGFSLFDGDGGRLALKQGEPRPGSASVIFEVADLTAELQRLAALGIAPESPVKVSPEGYRRAFVRDPDGNRVGLFEWRSERG